MNSLQDNIVEDDLNLLKNMMDDQKNAGSLYRPGPYWKLWTKAIVKDIKRFGLSQFRNGNNACGSWFGDSPIIDIRTIHNVGAKSILSNFFNQVYPFNRFFEMQVIRSKFFFDTSIKNMNYGILNDQELLKGLNELSFPVNSTKGDCKAFSEINGVNLAHKYIVMLTRLKQLANSAHINDASTYFEIGGGFGSFVHCLLQNYTNIRKVIYLDIPPGLYVGTQYLKSFFGESVKNYSELRGRTEIRFEDNNDLEILCIAPWQIESLSCDIDIFHNAYSFVEMPKEIVKNYGKLIKNLMTEKGEVCLISYDQFDLSTTFDPKQLPSLMGIQDDCYQVKEVPRALAHGRSDIQIIGSYKNR
jgi:putative sugar O-methyltransferase